MDYNLALRAKQDPLIPRFTAPGGVRLSDAPITFELADQEDHKADPIKNLDHIQMIRDYLVAKERYRDNMLFIMGINFGLRIGDLLKLRVGNIINENFEYRFPIQIQEKKTGKPRKLFVNQAVDEAFSMYIGDQIRVDLNDYLFAGVGRSVPMKRQSVDRIFRNIMRELELPYNSGTHMFRKTFAYWTLRTASDRSRALYLLQKTLNHSSATTTLYYAGITDDEIMETSMKLNLGYKSLIDVTNVIDVREIT